MSSVSSASAILPKPSAAGGDVLANVLAQYEGHNILEICGRCFDQYALDKGKNQWVWTENHCAHFVSHALSIKVGTLCWAISAQKGQRTATGATIRANDVFNACPNKQVVSIETDAKSATTKLTFPAGPSLIYVTKNNYNPKSQTMGSGTYKHVGILINGSVWQYSNRSKGPTGFVKKISADAFGRIYGKPDNKAIYVLTTDLPQGYVVVPFSSANAACKRDPKFDALNDQLRKLKAASPF